MARIVVTGAAGLVGQNLIARLAHGDDTIVAIDKHAYNAAMLAARHPGVTVLVADLAEPGAWEEAFAGCDAVVCAHAQIGGLDPAAFVRNNLTASERVLAAAKAAGAPYLVNISSSVVKSQAHDPYVETKTAQEALTLASGIPQAVLRPTLMFGWFDRKHVGWLARFMAKTPVFPIPGDGRYLRQPLYAGDFCAVVASALRTRIEGAWDITGRERIDYIDLMRAVKRASGAKAAITPIPYALFHALLLAYALVSRDPPFTVTQLKALVTPDVFEVIDWPAIFGVTATPLQEALAQTFRDPVYSNIVLEF